MRFLYGVISFLFITSSYAGVEAYSTASIQKLFIESAPSLGKDVYLIKFSGVESTWKDKLIKTTLSSSNHYEFNYEIELSSGVKVRTYQMVTQEGQTLSEGSLVKKVRLWTPQNPKDGVVFIWDKALTNGSQNLNLLKTYLTEKFKPVVD